MTFRRVDAHDPTQFDPWYEVLAQCHRHDSDGASSSWQPAEIRARASDNGSGNVWHMLAHTDGDRVVAISWLEVNDVDNTHTVRGSFFVRPDVRRLGHGRRAIAETEQYARELGRREVVISASEGRHNLGAGPNRSFAPRLGYTLLDEAARRDISWPRPTGELDRLEAQWLPRSSGYRIESWPAPSPDTALDDLAYLAGIMPVEAPRGELEIEPEEWDAERFRAYEQRADNMGRHLFVAVARHEASGRIVAFSQLTCSRTQPDTAYQWDTLVTRAHRGHKLGALMKIANMRQLERSGLPTERITTFNSVANAPMISVNDELGAEVAGAYVDWRKVFS